MYCTLFVKCIEPSIRLLLGYRALEEQLFYDINHLLSRREETALSRLHIGHSHVTHLFLLKGEEPPSRVSCDEPLSLEHTLLSCSI